MDDVLPSLKRYHRKEDWREILKIKEQYEILGLNIEWNKLSWVWPDENNLNFIGNHVKAQKIEKVVSIGCGTGLFEWLLTKCTGLSVEGIEIDEEWWTSPYAPPTFIPLSFTSPKQISDEKNTALLFCYFNNGKVFRDYVDNHSGNCVVIIGPGPDHTTHSDPEPLSPNFSTTTWKLTAHQKIPNSKDVIAIYYKE